MKRLSVVVITFNEARNITRCLESVQPVADDVVVVDSHSTDNTVALARAAGARVISHPFAGHIEQKNFAISQARYPHILSLDADEALDDDLAKAILGVKASWEADGYYLNRLTNYCGHWIHHGNWYPDRKLRLWDSRKGSWGGQNPHDTFILQAGATTRRLPGHVLHYSFYTVAQHLAQIERFTDISSRAAFENGRRSGYLHMIFRPAVKFLKGYLLKAGFLDGKAGWEVAWRSAWATYLKYKKLYQWQQNPPR